MGLHSSVSSFSFEEKERGKVLLVDDNVNLIDALSLVLVSAGFEVVGASGVLEAVSVLEKEIPDIIISDVMMDELDGFDLHDRVKEHSDWGHLPLFSYPRSPIQSKFERVRVEVVMTI